MRRRSEQRTRSSSADYSSGMSESATKTVSTEEHLRILKMVESGKITPEEAGMLLKALEE